MALIAASIFTAIGLQKAEPPVQAAVAAQPAARQPAPPPAPPPAPYTVSGTYNGVAFSTPLQPFTEYQTYTEWIVVQTTPGQYAWQRAKPDVKNPVRTMYYGRMGFGTFVLANEGNLWNLAYETPAAVYTSGFHGSTQAIRDLGAMQVTVTP